MLEEMGRRGPARGPLAQKALELRLKGLTYAEIGRQIGVSRQRAQQITNAPPVIRKQIVERAGGQCQTCGVRVETSGHVHHVGAVGLETDEYNDPDNLQLLCTSCHRLAHTGGDGEGPAAMHIPVDLDLFTCLDDYRYSRRFPSRSAAIKFLLTWALKQNPDPTKERL